MTGFSRGVVGTVAKPVAGAFDLVSATAGAISTGSKDTSRLQPARVRPPRCCHGPGGLLPSYSRHHAEAQEFLFSLNNNDYSEM